MQADVDYIFVFTDKSEYKIRITIIYFLCLKWVFCIGDQNALKEGEIYAWK